MLTLNTELQIYNTRKVNTNLYTACGLRSFYRCPVWSGICLSCGRRRRLYCCVIIDGGGSSPRRTWLELLLILLNNRSSSSSTSWTKSGRSGEQYPHRLLRWRNASMCWLSVPVISLIHADAAYVSRDTTIALKTVWRPASPRPWYRSTRSAYSDCALSLMTRRTWSDADNVSVNVTQSTFSV